ncbi:uncharacterized protein LOC124190068 isoform X2 [Daphnia pulex]|uniref:uncharacterized protein LOC124190068 isoform X2 n=1 Tax=Daphnia pulex TaxID=6669 RepID=UPI001EE09F0B|nr:uncharacterized protein LOC124190068 isoform X2 [Daphnia pulex]XP_046438564.1 uncharacterized protein LOC124190068 isoform X2 [Daphnia pulex]XP_046438565.1 uncharacterized protein LOC124190068 isoform X2 [Daphnia pulex]XP_046438566.1 uncharacterized protein LOC124190068 isoform X2 [Daphnia pulex]XP_046438567.1 uncharacterized protein LOC124190068 isoform X2 [Daphnia pulex]
MHKANLGHLVQAAPVADRLQQMTTALEPSLSEGLIHLSNLFDCVMNYDENIGNSHDDENATLLIRTALQSASNSLNTTESISAEHLQMYEENLFSFSADIAAKEKQLLVQNRELKHLANAINYWRSEEYKLRQLIAELDAKASDAEHKAYRAQRNADKKKKNRWKWITATVFTAGLATPGLVINEKDIKKLRRDRDAWRSQANARRHTLQVAQNNHRDIVSRQKNTEQSIRNTQTSLSSAQISLEKLQKDYLVLSSLGAEMRNISTFLFSLNGELSVVHSQQQLMVLFQPLLESIDSLITFLESNVNTIVLLANNEAVTKIRGYLSSFHAKEVPTVESNSDPSSLAQDKIDDRITILESESDAKIKEFKLDSEDRLKQFQLDSDARLEQVQLDSDATLQQLQLVVWAF